MDILSFVAKNIVTVRFLLEREILTNSWTNSWKEKFLLLINYNLG